jgi:UDP-glucuronate decarboxylase
MHESDGRVVSNFVVQCLRNRPITIFGDGKQTRSFCYVDDLIEGFTRLMASDSTQPINLGNPGEFTMLELAQLTKELTGSRSEIVYEPLPVDDPIRRKPDIARAVERLGWKPTIPLREGLERTIADFRRRFAP